MSTKPVVGLFVTCLVDLFRPRVGWASVKLIEDAGFKVVVPRAQTCCGQPAYNSGDRKTAIALARQVVKAFADVDYVVAPSGSCAAMLKIHIPDLLRDDPEWAASAAAFSDRAYELTRFLTDVAGVDRFATRFAKTVTYHDSCAGLRELGIRDQPRALLSKVEGLTLREMRNAQVCCGFGGTFCTKYPDISNAIVSEKTASIAETKADALVAGDLGCLLNMAGKLAREERLIEVRHIAEVLAGMTDGPGIGTGANAKRDVEDKATIRKAQGG